MFILKLYDRNGIELKLGDLVKISDGRRYKFYARVEYLEDQQAVLPFHYFTFHSFEKMDKLPEDAIDRNIDGHIYWYSDNPKDDIKAEDYNNYLHSWLEIDRQLRSRCFRIEKFSSL